MSRCDCDCKKIDIKFEDKSQNIKVDMTDRSESLTIDMAPVGNVLLNERAEVLRGTCQYWDDQRRLISRKNVFYLYTDYKKRVDPQTGEITYTPGLKIGDGNAYLIDIPFIGGYGLELTQEMVEFWNNKWRGFIDLNNTENLIFTVN